MFSKITCLFFALALTGCVLGQSNNFEIGNKGPNDRRLHYQIVQKSYTPASIVTTDIDFPVKGDINFSLITYIKATDQYTNGNGGYCSVLSGGLGFSNVKLHFKSQRNHGFNFILEIWGSQ